MLKSVAALLALAAALLVPHNAFAQATASIAGTVVDASGAVLPGVTVEASSPALIEKVRSVVTDGTGQYRIEQLRGGTYTVDLHAAGVRHRSARRHRATGSFAATINAEMSVGSVEETVTVTGESPIVDIQSANRQRVIDQELLEAIPTGRTPQVAAFMIPGVNLSNVDVGGTNIINTTGGSLSIHGGTRRRHAAADRRHHHRQHRGHGLVGQHAAEHGQHAGSGGGLLVGDRREHHRRAADQHDPEDRRQPVFGLALRHRRELLVRGLQQHRRARRPRPAHAQQPEAPVPTSTPGSAARSSHDKLWFYTSARFTRQANYIGGLFQNKNAYDITKWAYEPDENERAFSECGRAERQPAPDLAGQPDQQDQLLLRSALALPVPHRRRHRRAGGRQPARVPDQRPVLGVLYGHAVEPPPGRGARRRRGARSTPTRPTTSRIRIGC